MLRRALFGFLLALLLLPSISTLSHAAAIRWNNAAGGNWSVAANWSPAVLPSAADTAVFDLAGTYTVTVNQNFIVAALRVNGSASGTQTLTATTRTMNFSGPVTFGAQAIVNWTTCTVGGAGAITNEGTFNLSAGTIAQALTNSGTLVVTSAATQNGALTTVGGSVLRVLGTPSVNGGLTVTNGFTNNATIELTSSAATAATLAVTNGTLVNAAGAQINSLPGSGGGRNLNAQLDNQGTITLTQNTTTNKASADHVNSGTIDLAGANYTIVISGTTPSFTTSGTINVPATRTLTLQGGVAGGAGQNYYYDGGTLGGAGTVALLNSTLNLNAGLASSMAHLDGTTSIVAGPGTLTISAGTTVQMTSCSLNGPVSVVNGGTLQMVASDFVGALSNAGVVECINACTAPGPITTVGGSVLRVLGAPSVNGGLTVTNGFTNNATIELTSSAATAATLAVTNGTLVNAAGAQINSLPGSGGGRNLNAQLDNQGSLEVQQNLTLNRAAATHANSGTTRVSAAKTLTVTGASFSNTPAGLLAGYGTITMSGATALVQNGTVSPGASPGRLAFNTTNYPCAATSVYNAEVGGEAPATGHDQVAISGAAHLAGTLNVSIVNGYQPVPGRRYVIATFDSRTGTFSAVNGLSYGPGQMWTVAYSDTDVVLLAMDQTWTRLFPEGTPPLARDGHTAVFDSTGDRMIVFGGRSDAGPRNDAWVLTHATSGSGSQWISLAPSGTPPAARTNASAVYDPATNRMIVYGGDDGAVTPAPFGDTWVLTNANGLGGAPAWIPLSPASAPPARSAHGAAYDHVNNRMMMFGGSTTPGTCGGALADAWVLANANGLGGAPAWTLVLSGPPGPTMPSARQFHGAGYDPEYARLIVIGGEDGCGTPNTQGWLLDGANGLSGPAVWTPIGAATLAPDGWSLARYAYDPAYKWADGFGGKFGGAYVDTSYTLTGAAGGGGAGWVRRVFWGTRPEPRALHSMIVSGGNHVAVVFGGLTAGGRVNDVYRREIDRGRVLEVEPPVESPARPGRTAFAMPPSPNPARGAVALAVDVASDQRVDLAVFDLAGRRVATLHSGELAAGRYAFRWSGSSDGGPVAPGIYLVRLHAEDRVQVLRIVRLK